MVTLWIEHDIILLKGSVEFEKWTGSVLDIREGGNCVCVKSSVCVWKLMKDIYIIYLINRLYKSVLCYKMLFQSFNFSLEIQNKKIKI